MESIRAIKKVWYTTSSWRNVITFFLFLDALSHCFGITKPSVIFCDGRDYEKIRNATKSFKPDIYTISEHIEGVPSLFELLEPNPKEHFYQWVKIVVFFGLKKKTIIN